ncbi:calcium-binding protein [Salipiger mucosus]|nr:calcium-binding protein [Salipiger mucosus]
MEYRASLRQGLQGFGASIGDMEVAEIDGDTFLFAAAGHGAGTSVYRVDATGAVTLADQAVHAQGTGAFSDASIALMEIDGRSRIVTALHGEPGLQRLAVGGDGALAEAATRVPISGGRIDDAISLAVQGELLFAGHRGGGLSVNRVDASGAVTQLRSLGSELGQVTALAVVEVQGTAFLLGTAATRDVVVCWRIGANGALSEAARIGPDDGLGLAGPVALTVTEAGGAAYVVVAASDSASLSVLSVGASGSLRAVDHLVDGLDTRFGGASELTAVTRDGKGYLVAAGADDGMSLFSLLPDGKLLHLDAIADATDTPLDNVSALAAVSTGAGLRIFAASGTEAGIGAFDVAMGAGPVTGTSGDDRLTGTGGPDTLVAGAGRDRLTGGAGTDVFVFDGAGGRDSVADYRPGSDVIDLSLVPMLYSMDQLTVLPDEDGALLVFGDLEIAIESADGKPLESKDIAVTFGPSHYATDWIPLREITTGQRVTGTMGNDRLEGSTRGDELRGLGGNDVMFAGAGGDRFDGGAGFDTVNFSKVQGRVLVDLQTDVSSAGFARFFDFGHASGDAYTAVERFIGGDYADNLRGDAGRNTLKGGGVSDRLYGRYGDDVLDGGTGADALYGNRGADVMTGGPDEGRRDRFIYFHAEESGVGRGNRDVITDFTPGEDRIEISRFDADTLTGGKQGFTFIGARSFSGTPGELRAGAVSSEGITLVQADLDGDGTPDFEIELTGVMRLTAGDFLI